MADDCDAHRLRGVDSAAETSEGLLSEIVRPAINGDRAFDHSSSGQAQFQHAAETPEDEDAAPSIANQQWEKIAPKAEPTSDSELMLDMEIEAEEDDTESDEDFGEEEVDDPLKLEPSEDSDGRSRRSTRVAKTMAKANLRKRRKRNANSGDTSSEEKSEWKKSRANETPEQREKRLAYAREAMRRRRAAMRLAAQAEEYDDDDDEEEDETMEIYEGEEDSDDFDQPSGSRRRSRLGSGETTDRERERMRQRRQRMTDAELAESRRQARIARRLSRATETPEQREKRLAMAREAMRKRRQMLLNTETEEERAQRMARACEAARQRREQERLIRKLLLERRREQENTTAAADGAEGTSTDDSKTQVMLEQVVKEFVATRRMRPNETLEECLARLEHACEIESAKKRQKRLETKLNSSGSLGSGLCTQCGKFQTNLSAHVERVHMDPEERKKGKCWWKNDKIMCELCGKTFLRPGKLLTHMRKFHDRVFKKEDLTIVSTEAMAMAYKYMAAEQPQLPSKIETSSEASGDLSIVKNELKQEVLDDLDELDYDGDFGADDLASTSAAALADCDIDFHEGDSLSEFAGAWPDDITGDREGPDPEADLRLPLPKKMAKMAGKRGRKRGRPPKAAAATLDESGEAEVAVKEEDETSDPSGHACDVCGRVYKSKRSVMRHAQSAHADESQPASFLCEQCTFVARTSERLRRHLRDAHAIYASGPKPHQKILQKMRRKEQRLQQRRMCTECGRSFCDSRELSLHVKREHTKLKDAACQYCDYRAVSSKEVWKHALRMHTEQVIGQQDPSRVHECPKCPRIFYSPAQLRAHDEQAHIKDKKYACNQCDFRTAYPQSVKYHIREVHDRLRPFECPYCDYKAGRKANLELHLRTVHKQQKPGPGPKQQTLPPLEQE